MFVWLIPFVYLSLLTLKLSISLPVATYFRCPLFPSLCFSLRPPPPPPPIFILSLSIFLCPYPSSLCFPFICLTLPPSRLSFYSFPLYAFSDPLLPLSFYSFPLYAFLCPHPLCLFLFFPSLTSSKSVVAVVHGRMREKLLPIAASAHSDLQGAHLWDHGWEHNISKSRQTQATGGKNCEKAGKLSR